MGKPRRHSLWCPQIASIYTKRRRIYHCSEQSISFAGQGASRRVSGKPATRACMPMTACPRPSRRSSTITPALGRTAAISNWVKPADIRSKLKIRKGELDVLVGGPPCQGFSINAPGRFLTIPRNKLFKDYVRFLEEFEPKTFLFENVPGLLSLGRRQGARPHPQLNLRGSIITSP